MEKKWKKIGIMGGTFNPIHNGHLNLAKCAYEELGLDVIIFIPTGISYLKSNISIPDGQIRLQMVDLAIKKYPYFISSNIEIIRNKNTYTYETLSHLLKQYKDCNLYFILGADNLFYIENWMNVKEIFNACTIVAAVRDGISFNELEEKKLYLIDKFCAKIILLPFKKQVISSTEIRNCIVNKFDIKEYIPIEVEKFIKEKKLYI